MPLLSNSFVARSYKTLLVTRTFPQSKFNDRSANVYRTYQWPHVAYSGRVRERKTADDQTEEQHTGSPHVGQLRVVRDTGQLFRRHVRDGPARCKVDGPTGCDSFAVVVGTNVWLHDGHAHPEVGQPDVALPV
jgi:hypothetical protein